MTGQEGCGGLRVEGRHADLLIDEGDLVFVIICLTGPEPRPQHMCCCGFADVGSMAGQEGRGGL